MRAEPFAVSVFQQKASGVAIVNGRIRRRHFEDESATHRIFVQPDEARWTYTFTRGERRTLSVAAL